MSHRSVVRSARALAGVLYGAYRLTPHRGFIQNNIQTALSRSSTNTTHTLAKAHLFQTLLSIGELLRFDLLGQGQAELSLRFEGFDHLCQAQSLNRGVILVSAHFGFWELIPAILALQGFDMHVLVQRPSSPAIDRLFVEYRQKVGVHTHYNTETKGLKALRNTLKQGGTIALVVDQHGESEKIFGTFFGQRVSMPEGPIFFGRMTEAPLVPILTFRTPDMGHVIRAYPPLFVPPKPTEAQSQDILQRIYTIFEDAIREHPEAWLWSYNRWDKVQYS